VVSKQEGPGKSKVLGIWRYILGIDNSLLVLSIHVEPVHETAQVCGVDVLISLVELNANCFMHVAGQNGVSRVIARVFYLREITQFDAVDGVSHRWISAICPI
jgi:hypothetical protein